MAACMAQVEQIEVADYIVLNKMDLLEKEAGGPEKKVGDIRLGYLVGRVHQFLS